jgi:uridine kinase
MPAKHLPNKKRNFAETASKPILIAIVGGSGSGKTWLAKRLEDKLGRMATRLSLDDFYRDRSHLSPAQRARLNFDHPRAIDWPRFEQALRDLRAARPAGVPCYDFATHRRPRERVLHAKPIILVEGLWLLRRRQLARAFELSLFLDCPARVRFQRRLQRDLRSRGRTVDSIRRQFRTTVEPMHRRHVVPQSRLADLRIKTIPGRRQVIDLAARIRGLRFRPPNKKD